MNVCAELGYADVSQACEKLDQDEVVQIGAEKGSRRVLYVGPNANMYVTESGLYSLIVASNKPTLGKLIELAARTGSLGDRKMIANRSA